MSHDRKLWLLALLGLAVRAGFLLLEPATHPIADERTWTNWAVENLVTEKVRFSPFRTRMIFYPPLYPYFIAVPYALFGTLAAVKWAQVVVSALLVPALGRVATRVFGEPAGVAAAALAACYPDLVWFSVHFWSETLFLFFLWWAFERLLAADARASLLDAGVAGVLWGLGVLTRETGLYLTPLVALWLGWRAAAGGTRRGAAFLVAALLTVAPWTYRNWVVFQAFVPVSTAGGLNLYQGNAPLTRQQVYDEYEAVHGRVEQYRWARQKGIEVILERQPWWLFEKLRDEMPRFWEADGLALIHIQRGAYGPVTPAARVAAWLVVVLPYLAVLGFFVLGLAALRPDRRVLLLLGFAVLYNLLHVVTHGFARYRLPVMPVVFACAAWAFSEWRAGRTPSLSPPRRALAVVLAAAFGATLLPSLRAHLAEPSLGLLDQQDAARDDPR